MFTFGASILATIATVSITFIPPDYSTTTTVFVTHYNPVPAQTDASPCIGAGLTDVCELAKTEKIIALCKDY